MMVMTVMMMIMKIKNQQIKDAALGNQKTANYLL
jgi:hypothetical protein